ncbi:MAG: hypothetical protein JJE48_10245, partial [Actinobacteria bacterium]|nr:hypothetical protein [Actinomycetota bacterium]
KIVSAMVGSVSLAATAASIWGMLAVGGALFITLLAISGLTFALSTGFFFRLARPKKLKIEVLSGRPQEQKKQA